MELCTIQDYRDCTCHSSTVCFRLRVTQQLNETAKILCVILTFDHCKNFIVLPIWQWLIIIFLREIVAVDEFTASTMAVCSTFN